MQILKLMYEHQEARAEKILREQMPFAMNWLKSSSDYKEDAKVDVIDNNLINGIAFENGLFLIFLVT